VKDFGNFNCDTSSFSSSTIVFGPDEYQQHEQQTLEQYQEVEDLYLELIETDEIDEGVHGFEQHDPKVGQQEKIVQNGQCVELGERGQIVQTSDRRVCVVQLVVVGVFLKFHHSSGTTATIVKHVTETGANICGTRAKTSFVFIWVAGITGQTLAR